MNIAYIFTPILTKHGAGIAHGKQVNDKIVSNTRNLFMLSDFDHLRSSSAAVQLIQAFCFFMSHAMFLIVVRHCHQLCTTSRFPSGTVSSDPFGPLDLDAR